MFAFYSNINLKLVMNSEAEIEPGRNIQDFVSDIFGCSMRVHVPHQAIEDVADQVTWTVCCTRADFRPSKTAWDLNHWVPCLASGLSLSEKLKMISDAFDDERQHVFGGAADDPNNNVWTDAQVDSLMEYIHMIGERAQRLKRLTARLAPFDLCPVAVPADGNCGVWSLLCFLRLQEGASPADILQEDPMGTRAVRQGVSPEMKQRMRSLRQTLRDEWIRIADSPEDPQAGWWSELFRTLVVDAGGSGGAEPLEPMPDHPKKDGQDPATTKDIPDIKVKKEPVTPEQKRKHHNTFETYSPMVIKKGRKNQRAGILRDRVVDGPSAPLKLSLPEHEEVADVEGQKIQQGLRVKTEVKVEVKEEIDEVRNTVVCS